MSKGNKVTGVYGGSIYEFQVKKLVDHAVTPRREHDGDLGFDLFSSEHVTLLPNEYTLVSTGICLKFPIGAGGFIKDRSSISSKMGVFTHAGVIDNGYTGEIKVLMYNASNKVVTFYVGDKIAQLVLIQLFTSALSPTLVDEIDGTTPRGDKGFGSSGMV